MTKVIHRLPQRRPHWLPPAPMAHLSATSVPPKSAPQQNKPTKCPTWDGSSNGNTAPLSHPEARARFPWLQGQELQPLPYRILLPTWMHQQNTADRRQGGNVLGQILHFLCLNMWKKWLAFQFYHLVVTASASELGTPPADCHAEGSPCSKLEGQNQAGCGLWRTADLQTSPGEKTRQRSNRLRVKSQEHHNRHFLNGQIQVKK